MSPKATGNVTGDPDDSADDPVPEAPDTESGASTPTYPDSTNLKTDRVRIGGEPDIDAISDTGYLAQGNRYPQSAKSMRNEATAARVEADRLQAQADQARATAEALEARADEAEQLDEAS